MTDEWRPSCGIAALEARAALLDEMRRFFRDREVLEVQTALLGTYTVTDVNIDSLAVGGHGYLQTSPEYQLKRLLANGAPSLYHLSQVFRAGERGRLHNPEFTLLEWYRLGFDDSALMDEVAELVLANNRAQTLALLIARTQGLPMVNVHARYLDQLETEGWIDRELEFLPSDKQIAERQATGSGLRTPELAVLIAYTKNANVAEIMTTDLPDQPALEEDLREYFPEPVRDRYPTEILRHRLRREIATTQLVNQMANLSGISYDHRMTEDTGASVTDVTRAWLVAREVLDFPVWWAEISELDHMRLDDQLEMYLDCRRTAERCSMWFLRHRRPPVDIAAQVERFRAPVLSLASGLPSRLRGPIGEAAAALAGIRMNQGVPEPLAIRSSVWRLLHTTFDMIELAQRAGHEPIDVAAVYWEVFDRFELLWLWDGIGALSRSDRWQTQARSALRDDLLAVLVGLAENVLEHGSFDAWLALNERSVERSLQQLTEIRRSDRFNITNLSVALRQLRNLVQTSVRGI